MTLNSMKLDKWNNVPVNLAHTLGVTTVYDLQSLDNNNILLPLLSAVTHLLMLVCRHTRYANLEGELVTAC